MSHATSGAGEERAAELRPKVVRIDGAAGEYLRLFGGPPETATMRSGLVVLAPSRSVGEHTTGEYEEVLIVLSGVGQMKLGDGTSLPLHQGCVAYCPPATAHDVANTGRDPLRYIYVAARAR